MSQVTSIIDICNLKFQFNGRIVFAGINLQIRRHAITAIMGPSGSGKTTLLKLIGAQLRPDVGQVLFNDVNIHHLNIQQLYEIRRKMGVLFQSGALFTHLNVFDNVAFPLREHTSLPEDMVRDLVLLKLEAVGLRGAQQLLPAQLSGGMTRRVALARALALDPELMIYDEPFTGQDPITMGVLMRLIKRLNDALGLTSIVVSHDVAETAQIANYVYILADGKIIGEGSPQQIFSEQHPEVYQFIHGLADGAVPFHYPAADIQEDLLP